MFPSKVDHAMGKEKMLIYSLLKNQLHLQEALELDFSFKMY
jgi:hypothetical protein